MELALEHQLPIDRLQIIHAACLDVLHSSGDQLVCDLNFSSRKSQLACIATRQLLTI